MSRVPELVEAYVEHKRSLGYAIRTEAQALRRFAAHVEASGHDGPVTAQVALGWVDSLAPGEWYAARLYETVRTFSRYAAAVDEASAVLPKGPACHGRTEPYIYTDGEARAMMDGLAGLHSPDGLRAASASAMCGLMLSCGLRPSECVRLDVGDYDAGSAVLSVRGTKLGKSRDVPASDSAAAAIERHLSGLPDTSPGAPLFPRTGGARFDIAALEYAWRLARRALLPAGESSWGRRPPRPYDARHTFATRTIERWMAEGADVDAAMPYLCVYMGHDKLQDTYWYLSATPALLAAASERFLGYAGEAVRGGR